MVARANRNTKHCYRTRRVLDGIFLYVCLFTIRVPYSDCVCVCCHRYPGRNAHAQYCHLWPVRLYNIFPRYLTKGTMSVKSY